MANIFDIIGPIMIGPSSSHTAGAARMGIIARKLLGCEPRKAHIILYDSFAKTGKGHGTDRALIAGILGFSPDDERLKNSFSIAKEKGLEFSFEDGGSSEYHPNTARIILESDDTSVDTVIASVGGGRINVMEINGMAVSIKAELCTTIIFAQDAKGTIANTAKVFTNHGINIAFMQVFRFEKMGNAIMVFETDQSVPKTVRDIISNNEYVQKTAYISN